MRKILNVVIIIAAVTVSVAAQTKQEARQERTQYTNATGATLKVEMPAPEAFNPHTAYSYPGEDFKPGVVQVGPRTTYLKEGLTTDEVVRLLGKPAAISERIDDDIAVTIYEFTRSEERVLIAEFVKGKLVHSTMETRKQVAKAER